jgi:hypothetical protein
MTSYIKKARSKAGFSSEDGDHACEVYYRRVGLSCVFSCRQKDSMQRIFIKTCFLFTVGSVCRVKRFNLGGKLFADDEEVETELPK